MGSFGFNLEKQAASLSGAERAKLIIKDSFQKEYGDKNGFLDPRERQALLRMPDIQVREEYDKIMRCYQMVPAIQIEARASYMSFKYLYEILKKGHLLLTTSAALRYLTQVIEKNIVDENVKKDALRVTDMLQVLGRDASDQVVFKAALDSIKMIVPKAAEKARDFIEVGVIVPRINALIGFNVLPSKYYIEKHRVFVDEVIFCIEEHNRIMRACGQGVGDLDAYLIPPVKDR